MWEIVKRGQAFTVMESKTRRAVSHHSSHKEALEKLRSLSTTLAVESEKDATQDARLDGVEAKNVQQDTRLDALEALLMPTEKDNEQDARLDALEANDATQDSSITALQSSQGTQDSSIAALQANDSTQDSSISALQASQGTQDTTISAIQAINATQDTRLAAIEAVNVTQNNRLTTLEASVASLDSRVTANFVTLQDHETRITTLEAGTPPTPPTTNALEWFHANNVKMLLSRSGHRKPNSGFYSTTTEAYEITQTRYRARSLPANLPSTGLDISPDETPGQWILWDAPAAVVGYDYLLTPHYGGQFWNSTTPHIFFTLRRAAQIVIPIKSTASTPAWMLASNPDNPSDGKVAWTNIGTGTINTTGVRFMKAPFTAGDKWVGGFSGVLQMPRATGGTGTAPMLVLISESDSNPTAAPLAPPQLTGAQSVPLPGDKIRDNLSAWGWLHEDKAHRIKGLDGTTDYSTWHPQVDEVCGAFHGHDHGTDPAFSPFGSATLEAGFIPTEITWNGVNATWEELIVKAKNANVAGFETVSQWNNSGNKILIWTLPDLDTGHKIWYFLQFHAPTHDLFRVTGPMQRPTKFAMMYDPTDAPVGLENHLICFYQGLFNWGRVRPQVDTPAETNGVTFDQASIGVGPDLSAISGAFRNVFVHQDPYDGINPLPGAFGSYESWSPQTTDWYNLGVPGIMAFQLPGVNFNLNEPMVNIAYPGFTGGTLGIDDLAPFNMRDYVNKHNTALSWTTGNGVVRWMNWANLFGPPSVPAGAHAELSNGFGVNTINQTVTSGATGGFWTDITMDNVIGGTPDPSIHVYQFMRPSTRVRHQVTGKMATIDIYRDGIYLNNKAVFAAAITAGAITETAADNYLPGRAIEKATVAPN